MNQSKLIYINQAHTLPHQGESILVSMEKAGLSPEYQCRDGHCGACRCKLDLGEIEYTSPALAFVGEKEILPCICKSKTKEIALSQVKLANFINSNS